MNRLRKPIFIAFAILALYAWLKPVLFLKPQPQSAEKTAEKTAEARVVLQASQATPPKKVLSQAADADAETEVPEKAHRQSLSAAGYVPLAEVALGAESKTYRVQFVSPLDDHISLVVLGGDGRSHLQEITVRYENGREVAATGLSGDYFQNDWYRVETSAARIAAITFKGYAKSEGAKISLMLQKNY